MPPAQTAARMVRRQIPMVNPLTADHSPAQTCGLMLFGRTHILPYVRRSSTYMLQTIYSIVISATLSVGTSLLMAQPPVKTNLDVQCSGQQCGPIERGVHAFLDREVD